MLFIEQAFEQAKLVPDYEINEADVVTYRKLSLSEQDLKTRHPSELIYTESRKKLNYQTTIKEDEVVLFNLPESMTKSQIESLCHQVKGVEITNVDLRKDILGEKNAYAVVKVNKVSQIKLLKQGIFKNLWIEDKKIKLKDKTDLAYETFEHRTIIIQDIPRTYKVKEIYDLVGPYGSIVSLEMPVVNAEIEKLIKQKANSAQAQESKRKNEETYMRAKKIVQDSIQQNDEYRLFFVKHFGQENGQKLLNSYFTDASDLTQSEAITAQRQYAISSALSYLQIEDAEIQKAQNVVGKLKSSIEGQEGVPALGQENVDINKVLTENKDSLSKGIKYLFQNRDSLDQNTLAQLNTLITRNNTVSGQDPLESLAKLSRQELANAYDYLLNLLEQRQQIVEQRIKEQITHLGMEERILLEGKDFSKEYEALTPFKPFKETGADVEEIISVNEQINNVLATRKDNLEERFYDLISQRFKVPPKGNLQPIHLQKAYNEKMTELRDPALFPDPTVAPSINKLLFSGFKWTEQNEERIQEIIQEAKEEFQQPFDEIYHKEKKLIDQVVNAEKALKQKQDSLPSPIELDEFYDPKLVPESVRDDHAVPEHQFEVDQKKIKKNLLKAEIDDKNSKFEMNVSEDTSVEQLLEQGLISKRDYMEYQNNKAHMNELNTGYAFVTYSHADEAKLALTVANGNIVVGSYILKVDLKRDYVDHKDFDERYVINQMKRDTKMIDEMANLKQAREELRNFESNVDNELPSMKQLKDFRRQARDMFDEKRKSYGLRPEEQRTKEQEAEVNQRIRQLQKENPHIDYTQLFDSNEAENVRKSQHKKALEAYKVSQFIKYGIPLTKEPAKPQNKHESGDPYTFPPVEDTIKQFLTKDKYPRVMDAGQPINTPGRRFDYTDRDFMEAYLGKDLAMTANFNLEKNFFGLNESLKSKYPIEKFKQTPVLEARRKALKEYISHAPHESEVPNQKLYEMVQNHDIETFEKRGGMSIDTPHPTDPNRSKLKDLQQRFEVYMKRREQGGHDSWNVKDALRINAQIEREYAPPKAIEGTTTETAQAQEPQTDTKQTQKFEPFYEGEKGEATTAANDQQEEAGSETVETIENESTVEKGEPLKKATVSPTKSFKKALEEKNRVVIPVMSELPLGKSFLHQKEKLELEVQEYMEPAQAEDNKEWLYDYKHRKRTGQQEQKLEQTIHTQRLEEMAEVSNIEADQLFESLKDWADLQGRSQRRGPFTVKEKADAVDTEADIPGRLPNVKNLRSFASKDEDLSEREDEDIYAHYMEQMRKAKVEESKTTKAMLNNEQRAAEKKLKDLTESIYPEVPRFEGFFRSQSKNQHPLEDNKYQYEKEELSEEAANAEKEFDNELYRRELAGRLLGEKLTTRQFGVLYKAHMEEAESNRFIKDSQRKQFISDRDEIRILNEQKEKLQRQLMKQNGWTYKQAEEHVDNELKKFEQTAKSDKENARIRRELLQFVEFFNMTKNSKTLYDKEYIFDEGLGESVDQHIKKIKESFPDIEVTVRRDRDGYPVIKTQYQRKYKYDINELEKFNPEEYAKGVKETLESVHRQMLGLDISSDLSAVNQDQLQQKLIELVEREEIKRKYDLTQKSKDQLIYLLEQRVNGKFKNDNAAYEQAVADVVGNLEYDPTTRIGAGQKDPMDQLRKERKQIDEEIEEQLAERMREHYFLNKRSPKDIVKARRSEKSIFDSQVYSHENALNNLDSKLKKQDEKSETFDKEAYVQLKNEIKMRREAKERLLKQGFPELQSYIRI